MKKNIQIIIGHGAWLTLPPAIKGSCATCHIEADLFEIAEIDKDYITALCIDCLEYFFGHFPAGFRFKYCRTCQAILFGERFYEDTETFREKTCERCDIIKLLKDLSLSEGKDPKDVSDEWFSETVKLVKYKNLLPKDYSIPKNKKRKV